MKRLIITYLLLLIFTGVFSQRSIKKTNAEWILFDTYSNGLSKNNQNLKNLMGLGEEDEFHPIPNNKGSSGNIHIKQQQHFQGIPVSGAIMVTHREGDVIQSANGHLIRGLSLNTIPNLSKHTARDIAIQHVGRNIYAWESKEMEQTLKDIENNPDASFFPEGKLVIHSPDFNVSTAKLAYEFDIYALNPDRRVKLFLDANTGDVLADINLIHNCNEPCDIVGSGHTRYNGIQNIICSHNSHDEQYSLVETENRNIETRNRNPQPILPWLPNSPWNSNNYFSNPIGVLYESESENWGNHDPIALGVHWASEQWYDYFSSTHNWNSYDNQNSKILNVVHYGHQMNNAFWTGAWINYGDGHGNYSSWTSLDIVAHEISHGFIESTANFIYKGESGALSESFADIFAVMVERYALGENNWNWTIGEDITNNNEGIRDMSEFMEYEGTGWYYGQNDFVGVHKNSGVQNHWFYLLSNEIGIDSAAAICFHSLHYYLTSHANYHDAKNASIQAALDLYDQSTADIVCMKWNEVGVGNTCMANETITINTPFQEEALIIDNPTSITWTTTGNLGLVDIAYSTDGSSNWQSIVNEYPADAETYIWDIPNLGTNDTIFIRISKASNHSINDIVTPLYVQECLAVSEFSGNDHTCLGEILSFAVCTGNITVQQSYEWYLNGSLIGSGENVSWVSDISGVSEIELKAYDVNSNCSSSSKRELFVTDTMEAAAGFSYQKVGTSFYFTINNIDPHAIYTWDYGDGIMDYGVNPIHSYESDSIYTVCLTVDNDCDTFQYCKDLIIVEDGGALGVCEGQWTQYMNRDNVRALLETDDYMWIGTYGGGLIKHSKINGENEFFNSANSGLPSNIITSLLEDDLGNIWIGTKEGLVKFNGMEWEVCSNLSDDYITSLLKDNSGGIWIGTHYNGLTKFDGTTWDVYNNSNSDLPDNHIRTLLEDNLGNIWIGTSSELTKFNGVEWEFYNIPNSSAHNFIVQLLLGDDFGNIWIGTAFHGLIRFDGATWVVYNDANSGLPSSRIYSLLKDDSGNIWVGTNAGLAKFDGIAWVIYNDSNSDLPNNLVHSLLENNLGDIWVGTSIGFAKFNGIIWEIYEGNSNSNLPNNYVNSLLEDNSGSIWAGTEAGLAKFDGATWEFYNSSNSDLPGNLIYSLIKDDLGNIWVGTEAGLAKFDGTIWEVYNSSNSGLSSNLIYSLIKDDLGNIWVGAGGLAKFDGTAWEFYNSSNSDLPNSPIRSLLEDDLGNIWVGTSSGLAKFDGTIWEVYNSSNSSLPNNSIRSLLEDDSGNIWVGTIFPGLLKFDGTTWEVYSSSNSDLPRNIVLSLLKDDSGSIWIGTTNGFAKFDGTIWEVYNSSNSGLPEGIINTFLEDGSGNIWVGTNGGIGVIESLPHFHSTPSCARNSSHFENLSHNPSHTEWQINGETVSHETNLNYYFENSGIYEITLVSSNTNDCTDVYQKNITIPAAATELSDHLPEYISICGENPAVIDSKLYTYKSYTWIHENDTLPDTTAIISVTETGVYHLSIIDSCGTSATDSVIVILGEDCVWPGDTDKDGTVTNRDLLQIGLVYGETGSSRLGTSTDWIMQAASPWETIITGNNINIKHVDTNGNGIISDTDITAIHLNYGKNHNEELLLEPSSVNAPYTLIPVLKGINPNSHEIEISLELESDEGLEIPFYGMSVKLAYESSSVFDTLMRPLILETDIIGTDAISIVRQFSHHTDIAFVGTNHLNRTLQNQAAASERPRYNLVNYSIGTEKDLPGGDSTRYLNIMPREILMINSQGDSIPVKGRGLDIYLEDGNFDFAITTTPITCDSIGTATIHSFNANNFYSYLWSTGATGETILAPSIGLNEVTVTDEETGDIVWQGSVDIEGLDTLGLTIEDSGESLTANAVGGDGNYLYFWNDDLASMPSIPKLNNMDYSVTVMDGNGCTASTSFVTLPAEILTNITNIYGDTLDENFISFHFSQIHNAYFGMVSKEWLASDSSYYEGGFAKVGSNGTLEWVTELGDYYILEHILETDNGDFLLSGLTQESDSKNFAIRMDANGNVLWEKTYAAVGNQRGSVGLSRSEGDSYYLSFWLDPSGNTIDDMMILRIDGNGNEIWAKRYYIGGGDDQILAMNSTNDGGLVFSYASSSIGWDSGISKINKDGNIVMSNRFLGTFDNGYTMFRAGITETVDDGGYLGATKDLYNNYGSSQFAKFNANGEIVWLREFTPSGNFNSHRTILSTPQIDGAGNSYWLGYMDTGDFTPRQYYLFKLDQQGNTIDSKLFDSNIDRLSLTEIEGDKLVFSGKLIGHPNGYGQGDGLLMVLDTTLTSCLVTNMGAILNAVTPYENGSISLSVANQLLTVTTLNTPTVSRIYPQEPICPYCIPEYQVAGLPLENYIAGVEFNEIVNMTPGGTNAPVLTDFTDISTDVTMGSTYDLTIYSSIFDGYATNINTVVEAWIDYDNNGIFDSDESLGQAPFQSNPSVTFQVTIPIGITAGVKTMRIRNTLNFYPGPCDSNSCGEAEDYSVNILSPTPGIYVDDTATGANNGSSWEDAFTDLQDALALGTGHTIHIAEGMYYPTSGTARNTAFEIPRNTTILGGYVNGGYLNDIEVRDPSTYETILSGNIDDVSSYDGNSYHVVVIRYVDNVTLDGLCIQEGYAGNTGSTNTFMRLRGGGIFIKKASVNLNNVDVKWNMAQFGGGLFATELADVTITNSTFRDNTADGGSAIYHSNESSMYIDKTRVVDNTSIKRCAIEVNNSTYTRIDNSVIANNASTNANAIGFVATNRNQTCDIFNSTILGGDNNKYLITMQVGYGDQLDVSLYNSIIAHQTPTFSKTFKAYNNSVLNLNTNNCYIMGSGVFGNTMDNLYSTSAGDLMLNEDYSLNPCSSGVNSGDNSYASGSTDIGGNPRIINTIDVGAYETGTSCRIAPDENDFSNITSISVHPNPTTGKVSIETNMDLPTFILFDIMGKEILKTNDREISLETFPSGIYILNAIDANGIMESIKVFKE